MSKTLIAFFSASGTTARAARAMAEASGADIYEIVPKVAYTPADLDWTDKTSRSTLECRDPASRPEILGELPELSGYDRIFIGFPVWWYTMPPIIRSFLEGASPQGQLLIPFATSGGSGLGSAPKEIQALCPKARVRSGGLVKGRLDKDKLKAWMDGFQA